MIYLFDNQIIKKLLYANKMTFARIIFEHQFALLLVCQWQSEQRCTASYRQRNISNVEQKAYSGKNLNLKLNLIVATIMYMVSHKFLSII